MHWEIRPRTDGSFDELIAKGYDVHFEVMDDHTVWIGFTNPEDGMRHTLTISTGRKGLRYTLNEDA